MPPSLDSLEAVEGTCDQRAQADLSLRWSHKSYCRFCRALAYIQEAVSGQNIFYVHL